MKLELKKIKTNMRFSRETICFHAVLFADGAAVGDVENDGNGGCNFVRFYDQKVGENVKKYVSDLPPIKFENVDLPQNLDLIIGELINEHLKEKEKNRIQKIALKEKQKIESAGLICVEIKSENTFLWIGIKSKNDAETYVNKMIEKHKMKNATFRFL